MQKNINILGTEYEISTHKISEDAFLKKNNFAGYCSEYAKKIVIADMTEEEYFPDMTDLEIKECRKSVLRHEIVHAFLNESGLSGSANGTEGSWAKNEEIVDWIAIQSTKIFDVYSKLDIL